MAALWKRSTAPKPDRRTAWMEAARVLGGTFEPGKRPSGDRVTIEHGPWTITLETYAVSAGDVYVTYTRAKALFVGRGDPKLTIRKRHFFDTILENIGFGGVTPGDRALAERYVVKGRPEARLRSLLTTQLVAALLAESGLAVGVGKASRKDRELHGEQTCRLAVYTTGAVTDPSRLGGLITVARETLDALRATGLAR